MFYWHHVRCCIAALLFPLLSTACWAIDSTWTTATSGNWGSAARWTPAAVPNNGSPTSASRYDVSILATGAPYTVSLNSSVTVDSLTLGSANATIDHTAGTLTLTEGLVLNAGTYQFNGGTMRGGTISGTGGQVTFQPQGTFDGVTVDRDLTFSTGNFADAWIDVRNGLTLANNRIISLTGARYSYEHVDLRFQGNQTIGGSGVIRATGPVNNRVFSVGGTVTAGSNITLEAVGSSELLIGNSSSGFVNNGRVYARSSGSVRVEANNWVNNGQMRVFTGSTLTLRGSTTTANFGNVTNTGGTLLLEMTLNNAGNEFDFARINGPFQFSHATIVGGTITNSGEAPLVLAPLTSSGNVSLNGVTVDADLRLLGNTLGVANGMTIGNDRRIELREGTAIEMRTAQTIGGNGEIVATVLPNSSGASADIRGTGFTIGPGVTFRSDIAVPSESLSMSIEGENWTNAGTVIADHGRLSLEGMNWRNLGTIRVVGGTLRLDGTYSHNSLGIMTLGSGEHILDGEFDNTGNTFRVGGAAPQWAKYSGSFKGGRLEVAPGASMPFSSGRIVGSTISGSLDVSSVFYEGTVTLDDAVIHVGRLGPTFPDFSPLGNASLQGAGRILLYGNSPQEAGFGLPVNSPVLAAGISVESTTGDGRIFGRDGVGWTNDGTISMRASGRTIDLQGASVTNRGLIHSAGGGLIDVDTDFVNESTVEVLHNGKFVVRDSFRQTAAGVLSLRIGGSRQGVDYAFLDGRGLVNLGGTLRVELANGFTPRVGHRFDVLQWGTRVGGFASLELPALPFGRSWNSSALYTSGELVVEGVAPVGQTIAMSNFDEPALGAGSFTPTGGQQELGFSTTTSSSGGQSPTASVQLAGTNRVLSHRSINATTTFAAVDLAGWMEATVSVDIQVGNTGYEAGDFLRVYMTNGTQNIELFDETGNSSTDGLDNLATAGFLTYSAEIPFGWQSVSLVITSSSNSTAAAERYDFDNVRITAVAIPEPSSALLVGVAIGLLAVSGVRRRWHAA